MMSKCITEHCADINKYKATLKKLKKIGPKPMTRIETVEESSGGTHSSGSYDVMSST